MEIEKKLEAFVSLGRYLERDSPELENCLLKAFHHNSWFTLDNQKNALKNIAGHYLEKDELAQWIANYPWLNKSVQPKKVGLILAGNIPLVGFHDFLSVLMSGHTACVKCSDKDPFLLPFMAERLIQTEPEFKNFIQFIDRLETFDAVIATGSNNSSRYFEHYFASKPHIIRKNRQAIAVLSGEETKEELMLLGADIFTYFGLGCRNVSKIYVPEPYDFTPLLEVLHSFNQIILHHSYKNNFDYQSAIWLLNKVPHYVTGSILITEDTSIASRIATLHYQYYKNGAELVAEIKHHADQIQCVVAGQQIGDFDIIPFGKAQTPSLTEYADGVDTMEFLGRI
jgi:hypothetical protein